MTSSTWKHAADHRVHTSIGAVLGNFLRKGVTVDRNEA